MPPSTPCSPVRTARVGGWSEAIDLALSRPDLVVVTRDGDRFSSAGWRVRAGGGVVTAAVVDEAPGPGRRQRPRPPPRRPRSGPRPAPTWSPPERPPSRPSGPTTATRSPTKRRGPPVSGWPTTGSPSPPSWRRSAGRRPSCTTGSPGTPPAPPNSARSCPRWSRPGPRPRAVRLRPARSASRIDERIAEAASLRSEWEVRSAGLVERRRVLTERLAEVDRRLTGHADERREAAERRTRLEADATAVERLLAVVETAQAAAGLGTGRAPGALPAPDRGRPGRRGPARGAPPATFGPRARAGRGPGPPPEGRAGSGRGHHPAGVGDRVPAPGAGLRPRRGPVGAGARAPRRLRPDHPDRASWRRSWPPSVR